MGETRWEIRTISIPLFLATPILVLSAPKSIPITDMVSGDRYGMFFKQRFEFHGGCWGTVERYGGVRWEEREKIGRTAKKIKTLG